MQHGDDVCSIKGDEVHRPLPTLASAAAGYDSDHELTGAHAPQPNPNKRPLAPPGPDFDEFERSKAAGPTLPKGLGEVKQQQNPGPSTELKVANPPSPNLASVKDSDSKLEDEEVAQRPPGVMLI